MAEKTLMRKDIEVFTIRSPDGKSRASFVPELGGYGSSLVLPTPTGPRELFYRHTFFWNKKHIKTRGGWPFLFPVCGRLRRDGQRDLWLYEGQRRKIPLHGFSGRMPWEVLDAAQPDTFSMRITDTEATLAMYPFKFEVRTDYQITNDALLCRMSFVNNSSVPMPYYAGLHPYFLTPYAGQGKEQVVLNYKPVKRIKYNKTLTDLSHPMETPQLPKPITDPVLNECLTVVADDKETTLTYPDGMVLHMVVEGEEDKDLFPYIQLYTKPKHPFFCIEPWMSFPNALNTLRGSRWLLPGQQEHAVAKVWTTF